MSEKVDLSLAKPGDQCYFRDGRSEEFGGRNDTGFCEDTHPYKTKSGRNFTRNGSISRVGSQHPGDIVDVYRGGMLITPSVIDGPGDYETEESERRDSERWRAEIVGQSQKGGNWAGFCGDDREVHAWKPSGECVTADARRNIKCRYQPDAPSDGSVQCGQQAFTLEGKYVGWEGVTRDGRKVTVVEFVEWPKANGSTEEACRVRDHQTQWSVRLNGRVITAKENDDDIVGEWVEPPQPLLTITEKARMTSFDGIEHVIFQTDYSRDVWRQGVSQSSAYEFGYLWGNGPSKVLNLSPSKLLTIQASRVPELEQVVAAINELAAR